MWPFNRKKKKEEPKKEEVKKPRYRSGGSMSYGTQYDTANHMLNYMIIDSMVNDGHHHKHDSQDAPSHSHDHGSSYDSSSHDSGSSYDSGGDSSSFDSGSSGD